MTSFGGQLRLQMLTSLVSMCESENESIDHLVLHKEEKVCLACSAIAGVEGMICWNFRLQRILIEETMELKKE